MNFLLAIVLVVSLAKLLGELFERLGMTSILGEFGAGLVLGVSFLNLIQPSEVEQFAYMGAILLMFLAGYEETNLKFLLEREKKISVIGIGALVLTLLALFVSGKIFFNLDNTASMIFAFIFSMTDVAVGANILLATRNIESDTGESLLGISVVDTVVGLVLLALAVSFLSANSLADVGTTVGKMIFFFVITVFLAKYLTKLVHSTVKMHTEKMEFSVAFVSIFLLAYLAEELNLAAVLGSYFAGIILQHSRDLSSEHFSTTVRNIAYGFFISIFFAWVGLSTNLRVAHHYFWQALLISVLAIVSKFLFTFVLSALQKVPVREALIYSFGMIAKGSDNIIVLAIGLSIGALASYSELFLTSLVVLIVLSLLLSTLGLRILLSVGNKVK
ncbi:cation:proton antiporter [Candidatus Woesearchaeota archaeon]|nr:MAG: cation:proton antiporter [Candidatus Woesearchaeota archaeon]